MLFFHVFDSLFCLVSVVVSSVGSGSFFFRVVQLWFVRCCFVRCSFRPVFK